GLQTLVLECGVSESLDALRRDAKWWLKYCGWSVNIVLPFSTPYATLLIQIGKWELLNAGSQQVTRSNAEGLVMTPAQTDQIEISYRVAVAGSLTLEFAKVFLRPPVPGTLEADLIFTINDLEWWARLGWL
ncbi:hypothetical protein HOY80DRAFT_1114196, partial [Tuber brumale]